MPNTTTFLQKGFIASLATLLILIFMLGLAMSMSLLILERQKISTNTINATQSYYAAQAGAEDSLLRLKNYPQTPPISYSVTVSNATTNVTIASLIGGSRTITSQGNNYGLIKTTQIVYSIDSNNISFYYGVDIGQGGLVMNNGSEVMGNVFSGGNISGSGTIDNNVVISGNGHSISGVAVTGDALVYSCLAPASVANLTYVTGGSHTCTVRGTTSVQSSEIAQQPLPIPQSQIDNWKAEATTACSATNVSNLSNNNKTVSMGPCRITGNLSFGNGTSLTLTGTVYVTGNITLGNNDTIKLNSSYGPLGGVLLADGVVNTGNSNTFAGSGQAKSYLLFLSTNVSDSAIAVSNNSNGAVFYTSAGGIQLANGVSAVELTGYKVIMLQNSKIQYSNGVVNIFFSNGPGGGWKVTSWQEQ